MPTPGVHEPVTPGVRTVETPQRVTGPERTSNVPAPSKPELGVAESLSQSVTMILKTGLDTFRTVAIEAVPSYFAAQAARDARGGPMNFSPNLQRTAPTAEEIADAVQRRASVQPIASMVKNSDSTIKMALIIGGVLLAVLSLGRS